MAQVLHVIGWPLPHSRAWVERLGPPSAWGYDQRYKTEWWGPFNPYYGKIADENRRHPMGPSFPIHSVPMAGLGFWDFSVAKISLDAHRSVFLSLCHHSSIQSCHVTLS